MLTTYFHRLPIRLLKHTLNTVQSMHLYQANSISEPTILTLMVHVESKISSRRTLGGQSPKPRVSHQSSCMPQCPLVWSYHALINGLRALDSPVELTPPAIGELKAIDGVTVEDVSKEY